MTTPSSLCGAMHRTFDELVRDFPDLENHLLTFVATRSNDDLNFFQAYSAKHDQYLAEYDKHAMELMAAWAEKLDGQHKFKKDDFMAMIKPEANGRYIAVGHVTLEKTDATYFPATIRKIEGDLIAWEGKLEWLDGLEEVTETLSLGKTPLVSAVSLRRVGGIAHFGGTNLTALDALEETGYDLHISDCPNLASMKRLRQVGHTEQMIGAFGKTFTVGMGNLFCDKNAITELPSLERVEADFEAAPDSTLTSCPKLQHIGGEANIWGAKFKALDELVKIGKKAEFPPTIQSMKKLESIGNELDLRGCTEITDFQEAFPSLKEIGWNEQTGLSVWVDTPELAEQLEALNESKKIDIKGHISSEGQRRRRRT